MKSVNWDVDRERALIKRLAAIGVAGRDTSRVRSLDRSTLLIINRRHCSPVRLSSFRPDDSGWLSRSRRAIIVYPPISEEIARARYAALKHVQRPRFPRECSLR